MSVEERIEGEIKEKIKVLIIREIQRRLEKQRREMRLEKEILVVPLGGRWTVWHAYCIPV